ncbi:MAG: hypothetical protein OXC40_05460 [Proteobacteria bacterium]|nr:hypothetical protein [Pseudomonadota bacterium]
MLWSNNQVNIIGLGRVGTFIRRMMPNARCFVRNDSLVSLSSHPTWICVRMKDLDQVLQQIPTTSKQNLIFLQNGIYQSLLDDYGVLEPTKMLVYFAINKIGDTPVDSLGMSVVTGKHSKMVSQMFASWHLDVKPVSELDFYGLAHEKLIWLAVFGLLGDCFSLTVQDLVTYHRDHIHGLIWELASLVERKFNIHFAGGKNGLVEGLVQYSHSLGAYRATVKEFHYRNGYFLRLGKTPKHEHFLHLYQQAVARKDL